MPLKIVALLALLPLFALVGCAILRKAGGDLPNSRAPLAEDGNRDAQELLDPVVPSLPPGVIH
jgi:UPF0716 family protein affecting phage T7 exclusion